MLTNVTFNDYLQKTKSIYNEICDTSDGRFPKSLKSDFRTMGERNLEFLRPKARFFYGEYLQTKHTEEKLNKENLKLMLKYQVLYIYFYTFNTNFNTLLESHESNSVITIENKILTMSGNELLSCCEALMDIGSDYALDFF